jgi:hypothetical protein
MRSFFTVLFCCIIANASMAQSAPSKNETIEYIRKKVTETNGYQLLWNNGTVDFIHDAIFYDTWATYENGKYNIRYNYKDNYWYHNNFEFKPEFISSVTEASTNTASNSSVGFIAINFSNTLVKKKVLYNSHGGSTYINEYAFTRTMKEDSNVNVVYLPYLKQDPTAFERLKKAILHLKTFYISKDPFAN